MQPLTAVAARLVLAHPRAAAILAVSAILAGAAVAAQLELADDARALIAGAEPGVEAQLRALSEFSPVDQLLIQVEADDSPSATARASEAVVQALSSSGAFQRVQYRVSTEQQQRLVELVRERSFLLDSRSPAELLDPTALDARLRMIRATLLSPGAVGRAAQLMQDPFGTTEHLLASLRASPGLSRLTVENGLLVSQDGSSRLVVATPAGDPFRATDAQRTMQVIDELQAQLHRELPNVTLRVIGAHRFARDAERMIRRDVNATIAVTLLLVLAVFVGFFRRLRLLAVVLPPLSTGVVCAGAVAALWPEPVHGIVLAFAAACLGLSIDYTIHMLAAVAAAGDARGERLATSLSAVSRSLLLAVGSTLLGLAVLGSSTVPALRQMAVVAAAGISGAFVGNLLWLPLLLPRLGWRPATSLVARGPWRALAGTARQRPKTVGLLSLLLFAAAVWFGAGVRFDGDLRRLDTHTAEAAADEAAFFSAFGDPSTAALAIVNGAADIDQALLRAERAVHRLHQVGLNRVLTPTTLAPSGATAMRRRDAWCALRPKVEQALPLAAVRVGFRAEAFAPFLGELERLCKQPLANRAAPGPALTLFADLIGRPMTRVAENGDVRAAVAFEAKDGTNAATAVLRELDGVVVVHRAELNRRLTELIAADVPRLGGLALLLVLTLLLLVYRNWLQSLRAVAPVLLGGSVTLALMVGFQWPINLMSLCLLPLLAGLGIDYGVIMADSDEAGGDHAWQHRAFSVAVAACTSLAGFGALAFAQYGAIVSIGRAVVLGVTCCALAALLVVPALGRLRPTDVGE